MKAPPKAVVRHREQLELDSAARLAVFERDRWRCARCSGKNSLEWSHVFTRGIKSLRHDPDNALALCLHCHRWWHDYPAQSIAWFRDKWPDRFERIFAIRFAGRRYGPTLKRTVAIEAKDRAEAP